MRIYKFWNLSPCPVLERLHLQNCQLRDKKSAKALFITGGAVKEIFIGDCWGLADDLFSFACHCWNYWRSSGNFWNLLRTPTRTKSVPLSFPSKWYLGTLDLDMLIVYMKVWYEKYVIEIWAWNELVWFDVCKSTLNVMMHVYRRTNCWVMIWLKLRVFL